MADKFSDFSRPQFRDDVTGSAPSCPRVGFIVTNRSLPNERVLAFYNDRGTAEQHITEGKYALKWTRLSTPRAAAIVLAIKCGLKGKYFR